MQETPLRIASGGNPGDRLAIAAGKSVSGGLVQVFVANYVAPAQRPATTYEGAPVVHIPNEGNFLTLPARSHPAPATGYALVVRGLHPGGHIVRRYRVSAAGALEKVFEQAFAGTQIEVRSDLAPSGVELVQVVDPA
jgi:hypothetical protein